jgi:hypothetical protein
MFLGYSWSVSDFVEPVKYYKRQCKNNTAVLMINSFCSGATLNILRKKPRFSKINVFWSWKYLFYLYVIFLSTSAEITNWNFMVKDDNKIKLIYNCYHISPW